MTSTHFSSPEKIEAAVRSVCEIPAIIERLMASLDGAFELITDAAPDIEAALGRLRDRLSDINFGRFFEAFIQRTGTTRGAFENLDAALEHIGRHASGLVDRIQGLASYTDDIHSKLEEVVEVSDNLTLVALNARMLSSAAGTTGAAFGAITQELTGTSREVSAVAKEFIGAMQSIENRLGELEDIQKKITETLVAVNLDAAQQITSDARLCYEAVSSINDHAAQTESLCNAARPSIKTLMKAVHRRDTLGQCLEHIKAVGAELKEQISLFGAPGEGDTQVASRIAFVAHGALLSRELLMETSNEIFGFSEQVEELLNRLGAVSDSLALLADLRDEDLQTAGSSRRGVEELASSLSALNDLDEAVSRSQNTSEANCQEMGRVSKVLSRMKKLSDTVSVIEVVMRIKTASNVMLEKDAQFLAKEIRAGQKKISAALDAVHENLRCVAAMVQNDTLGAFRTSFSELKQARDRTSELGHQLASFTEDLTGPLGQAVEEGDHLRRYLDEVRSALDGLQKHVAGVSDAAASLESIATLAAEDAQRLGLGHSTTDGSALSSKRLEELVNRFAVLSQKMMAGVTGDNDIEQGCALF